MLLSGWKSVVSLSVAAKPATIFYFLLNSPKLSSVLAKARIQEYNSQRHGVAQNFAVLIAQLSSSPVREQLWFSGNLSHILLYFQWFSSFGIFETFI